MQKSLVIIAAALRSLAVRFIHVAALVRYLCLSVGPTTIQLPGVELVTVSTLSEARAKLVKEPFAGIIVDPSAFPLVARSYDDEYHAKLDTLYRAGLELASLQPERLASLSSEERINILKLNILKQAKEILNYELVDIRLINPATGLLEPLVSEGMDPSSQSLKLCAQATNNGLSGHVAVTGRTYYCPDVSKDPLYIRGAPTARSSICVPLSHQGQVIGVMNVDSDQLDGFKRQDREFLELFGREIGAALHTLKLLSAERQQMATLSVDLISREVAIPVDGILNAATALLDRYIGMDKEMTDRLEKILVYARSIRRCIHKAMESILPPEATAEAARAPKPQPLSDMRVLVVDHDERILRSAHAILEKLGCIVETAREGKEALAMARLTKYDAVLADINLPDMNGYEIFTKLRAIDPSQQVVLMNGYGYDPSHSIVRARAEGLAGALYKPFRVDQLLDVLEKRNQPPENTTAETPAEATSGIA